MKKNEKLFLSIVLAVVLLAGSSCGDSKNDEKDGPNPPPVQYGDASIQMQVSGNVGESAFSVAITPNEHTSYYDYAIGTSGDRENFDNGLLGDIKTIGNNQESTVSFTGLLPGRNYAVFARAFNGEKKASETVELQVKTAVDYPEVAVNIKNITVSGVEVVMTPNNRCGEYLVATMLEEAYEPMLEQYGGGDPEALLTYLEPRSQAFRYDSRAEATLRLAARCSTPHLIVIIPYEEVYDPELVQIINIITPDPVDDAPEAVMTVRYENLSAEGVTLIYTPGENCTGFYINLYETYWFEYFMDAGTMKTRVIEDDVFSVKEYIDDEWEGWLEPGESYTAVGLPVNVNGLDGGLGEIHSVEFTTPGTRGYGIYKLDVPGPARELIPGAGRVKAVFRGSVN